MHGEGCTRSVVHDDDLPALQLRSQYVSHVESERLCIRRALNAKRRSHPLYGDRGDQRYVLSPSEAARCLPISPLSSWCPGVAWGESDVRRRLVQEHQSLGGHTPHSFSESTSLLLISLGGRQSLFLYVQPSFSRMARLMVATETQTPVFRCHSSQWSSRVASSFSSSWDHSILFSWSVARMRLLRPVEYLGDRSSPSRLFRSQRLRVAREIPKVSTTSLLGIPRWSAASVFILRSFE